MSRIAVRMSQSERASPANHIKRSPGCVWLPQAFVYRLSFANGQPITNTLENESWLPWKMFRESFCELDLKKNRPHLCKSHLNSLDDWLRTLTLSAWHPRISAMSVQSREWEHDAYNPRVHEYKWCLFRPNYTVCSQAERNIATRLLAIPVSSSDIHNYRSKRTQWTRISFCWELVNNTRLSLHFLGVISLVVQSVISQLWSFQRLDRCIQAGAFAQVSPWLLNITRYCHKTLKVYSVPKTKFDPSIGKEVDHSRNQSQCWLHLQCPGCRFETLNMRSCSSHWVSKRRRERWSYSS